MRVVVVGAGVFGAWSAKCLVDAGHRVTLVDAYGPANARASSADHSRIIRAGYGADEIYSHWATQSLREWQWLAAATGQAFLARTGALFMGPPDSPYISDTCRTLQRLGIAAEWLEPQDVQRRFPQISTEGLGGCVFEAHAGVIRARAAVQALVGHLMANHRVSLIHARVDASAGGGVRTSTGEPLDADAFVFACGAWLPQVFPDVVGNRIRATQQEVLFFGTPPGDSRFAAAQLPVWIDFTAGLYGIPDLDARGFKVGVDRHGAPVHPDTLERLASAEVVAATREWIGRRFPAMHEAPLLDAHVCQYENTASGDFIIDRHPGAPAWWIVGGGSGHGFKHGPAVGRHVAELVDGRADVQPRFSLAAKSTVAARTVY